MSGQNPDRRVVHLLNSTAVGGAETVVLRLATKLQDLGWEPEVVTLRGEGPLSDGFRRAGIPVTDLGVPANRGVLALRASLRRWWRDHQPALLHSHNVSPLVTAALALPRTRGPRLVHTKHGRARADNWQGRALTWWAARRADAIAAVSRDALTRAIEREHFPADRLHLVYNGIDTTSVTPKTGDWGARIITVARLEPVKAIHVLIQALARLRAAGCPASLSVVGDGSERPALERLTDELGLREHVIFTGWRADVESALHAADLFAMSSRSEGLSLTLLEAMAVGLPVVATAVGGNPEVVEHGVTGLLVQRDDPDQLAEAIGEVLATPERAASLGRAGRERVMARFSLDVMARAYDRLYRDP